MPPRRTHAAKREPKSRRTTRSKRRGSRVGIGKSFEALVALQRRLRAPNGCPWDQQQTHQSLRPFLIEEAYEVLDAMDAEDASKFAAELGDLLLQIVFHAELGKEEGKFDIADVIEAVHSKMVRRHPHVFGKVKARTSAQVLKNWEQIKAEERKGENNSERRADHFQSVLEGVPKELPALLEGYQLTRRAASIGFDWESAEGILEKITEEVGEVRGALADSGSKQARKETQVESEIGDLFFSVVNLARFVGVDPERALKQANGKFARRFRWMEKEAGKKERRLADVSRQEMEGLWNESKALA